MSFLIFALLRFSCTHPQADMIPQVNKKPAVAKITYSAILYTPP